MAHILTIPPEQVEALQGADGGAFRDFVNRTIRAQAAVCNIAHAAIARDSRNVEDGGVDCEVKEAAPADPTGYLRTKSCWQYKATPQTSVNNGVLREEINKDYAKKLIGEGYAYRFCIADSIPAKKQAEWEETLRQEVEKINPRAPSPQIVTSTSLADWASQFPAIVASYVLIERFLNLDTWGKSATSATPTYVPVAAWEGIAKDIVGHVDFSKPAARLNLPVHADAGVGKTRLVYETLLGTPSARSLVLYTSDDQAAQNIAYDLATLSDRHAILVIDECSLGARLKVEQCLRGHGGRVRVITIANYARTSISVEPTLQQMPNETVEKILEANFPDVSQERRRAAVSLAGGFVKIAADICQFDVPGGLISAESYYKARIPDVEMRKVIEAISLVKTIGFSGEVSGEFDELCKLTGLNSDDARRRALQLKELPGFVAIGGRYVYVTPEAIALIALQSAWTHWVQHRPEEFFKRVPDTLLDTFQARLARSGNEQFRNAAADFFTDSSSKLTPDDLGDKKKVERLVALIDTDPSRFLPILGRLIEQASVHQLLGNSGNGITGWGPRRAIIWMCERLSSFPEYFYDVERILFRLAEYESEPGIGNNATATWKQLFSLVLSGTSLPYVERLKLLEKHLDSSATRQAELALDALGSIFSSSYHRMLGPAIVAGRIPPPDWRPTTNKDYFDCFEATLALYEKALGSANAGLKEKALDVVTQHIGWFLRKGLLKQLQKLLAPPRITIARLPAVFGQIDRFFRFERRRERKKDPIPEEYRAEVLAWKESLIPSDFHARVVTVVGQPQYHFYDEEDGDLKRGLVELAEQFCKEPTLLSHEIEWLTSAQAEGAGELGIEIGKRDPTATLFDAIVLTKSAPNLALGRGYLVGLARNHPGTMPRLNFFLDKLEEENPEVAFDYASTVPAETDAFARWVRLCDSGKIPAHFLQRIIYRVPGQLSSDYVKQAVPRLLAAARSEPRAGGVALNFVHHWIEGYKRADVSFDSKDADLWNSISEVLGVVPDETMEVFYWTETMKVYMRINPEKAVEIACGFLDEDLSVEEAAEEILVSLAAQHPDLVINGLGHVLLNEKDAWKLEIRGFGGLLRSLPPEVVMKWLDKTSLQGVLKIASSLPRPFINEKDEAVVPRLTQMVLERFGNDEKVVRRFISHSGVRSYSGDIAAQHLQEAKVAARFLQHQLPAIREWARIEKEAAEHSAERWQQEDAERFL